MKVRFNEGKGFMYCTDLRRQDNQLTEIKFPIASLPNWYPISLHFIYLIGIDGNVYLDYAPNMEDEVKYGLQDGDTDDLEFPIKLNTKTWYCAPVAKENEKIISYGKQYGIPEYGMALVLAGGDPKGVQESIMNLQMQLETPVYTQLEKRLFSEMSHDSIAEFRMRHETTRAKTLLGQLHETEELYLRIYGCLRIWLNVLKKIGD